MTRVEPPLIRPAQGGSSTGRGPVRPGAAVSRTDGRRAQWHVVTPVAALLLISLAGIHVLLSGAAWWFPPALAVVVVLVVAAVVRVLHPNRVLPLAAALIAFVLYLTLAFGGASGVLGLIPTPATLDVWSSLVQQGQLSILQQGVPADPVTGIVFLLVLGAGAAALAADALAFELQAPVAVGTPALVLLAVPVAVTPGGSDPLVFVLAAVAYLALLRLSRLPSLLAGGARSGEGDGRLSLVIGAVAIVGTLVVAPLLPPTGLAPLPAGSTGPATIGVNPIIDLGRDLRRPDPVTAYTYTTTSDNAQYFKLTTLEDFSGQQWQPADGGTGGGVDRIGDAPGLDRDQTPTNPIRTDVQIGPITGSWLPAPYPATSVEGLNGDWSWETTGLAIRSGDSNIRGQDYRVQSLEATPSAAELRAAGTPRLDATTLQRTTALPANVPGIIERTAQQVTDGQTTAFDKALALQSYFRNGTFSYSEQTPVQNGFDGTGLDAMAQFLRAKEGYCVHFASAMAVMAREVGIPSRVAVGFTPGTGEYAGGDVTKYEVSTSDLHAWPELYFEGAGWVRFEPTPGRGYIPDFPTGVAAPSVTDTAPTQAATTAPAPTTSSAPNLGEQQNGTTSSQAATAVRQSAVSGSLAVLVLLLLAVPAFVRTGRRRRRRSRLAAGASGAHSGAWTEVLDTAVDLGLAPPTDASPRVAQTALGLEGEAGAALDRMRVAVEREAYAATGRAGASADDLDTVLAGLRAAAPVPARIVARLAPRSLLPTALSRPRASAVDARR